MGTQLRQIKGKPGLFQMQTAKGKQVIKLVEWKEDFVYDTTEFVAGSVAAGFQAQFFVNLANKQLADTNMVTPRRLQSGMELILNQLGIMVCHRAVTNTETVVADNAFVYERCHFEFRINNITIAEGPAGCFPSGMGVTGSVFTGGAPGIVTNGVASPAAVPRLLVPQTLNEWNDVQGLLTHHAAPWATYTPITITNPLFVRSIMRGYVKTAIGKG